ncbi:MULTISPECIES: hypothetical protein [Sphingobium]|jgi:hypothetical protein|uniref:hypothetical protein n=1 Tax=Sphingobium TaxID=165695 RepID=UPI000C9FD260|nr:MULTISPECIES: hypothetical protein [unclassified Sphingobium]MCB4861851.1 hypothetical protein [Sphingobium sp. PNB]PNQ01697.1 hypothetical protein A8G00_16005 [Sphingobium sp. SA916]UXC93298.1 hypothetical protein EGM87_18600 [Sphingobium sp. RSMS]
MRSSALALLAVIPLTTVHAPAAAMPNRWYCGSAPPGWTPPWQRKPATPDDKNAPCHVIPCDRKKIRSETCR